MPWAALEEVIGALEGGRAHVLVRDGGGDSGDRLVRARCVVVAPAVAYMDVRRSLLRLQEGGRSRGRTDCIT